MRKFIVWGHKDNNYSHHKHTYYNIMKNILSTI